MAIVMHADTRRGRVSSPTAPRASQRARRRALLLLDVGVWAGATESR